MRRETVKNLYDKLQYHQFVQMRGPPASGTTTLVRLLTSCIRKQEPDVRIYEIIGKDASRRLSAALSALPEDSPEKVYLLWDECQRTYDDPEIWSSLFIFKDAQGNRSRFFVVSVCAYGSAGPHPNPDDPGSHFTMDQHGRVNLLPSRDQTCWGDEFPVGLLLDDNELKDIVRCGKVDNNLTMMISEWSGGHVGFVVLFLRFLADIRRDDSTVLTLEDFIQINLAQRFYDYIKAEPTALSLPQAQNLGEINIIRIFRKILRDGFVSQREPLVDAGALDLDFQCLPQSDGIVIDTSLYDFCVDIIKQFKSSQLCSPSNRASAAERDRMAEAVYQDEFYRGMVNLVDVQVSPEFASTTSRKGIEFYIPAKKWAIKVLREDDLLPGRDRRANYKRWIQAEITDFIILDFSVKEADERHPNIPELVHIQFDEGHGKFTVLDYNMVFKELYDFNA
ncbi:hypothetical protein C8J56DRAFT_1038832 [Mycena floridula]|nr:hypothetical protein C8J56DRAFT_1038832 [Mycena floridula]